MASPQEVLTVRLGRASDWEAIWRWRCDPATRAMSRRTQELPPEVVRAEIEAAVADEDKQLVIGEHDGSPFGVVKFDRREDDRWEVSINLAPEARGKGLARRTLELAIGLVFPESVPTLTAEIRPENVVSRRLFETLGFRLEGEVDDRLIYGREREAR